jgi:hypothetical protein
MAKKFLALSGYDKYKIYAAKDKDCYRSNEALIPNDMDGVPIFTM